MEKTKKAYSGSLIQQSFGETIDEHGFLLWNINDGSVEEFDIDNDYKRITVNVGLFTDYDNLYFELNHEAKFYHIRVIWEDLISNINHENEQKLKKYFTDRFVVNEFKIDKRVVLNDRISVEGEDATNNSLTSIERINEIFTEYLLENGYDSDFIDEIMEINTTINNRIEDAKSIFANSFSIKKIWGENLFSYGEFELDMSGINGIVQINGKNEVGKTTIYKTICYILYGQTIETSKSMKYGDIRYINNKLNIDECLGGAIISVNNIDYAIIRKTVRKKNKQGDISGASTNVEYFEVIDNEAVLTNPLEDNKITELSEVLGSFDSFIRLVLTTGDNLNSLLSSTHAKFVDSLLTDLGLDIFEQKLIEFKKFKAEYWVENERLNLDLNKIENLIIEINSELESNRENKQTLDDNLNHINSRIESGELKINNILSTLHQIDTDIPDDIKELNDDLDAYEIELKNTIKQEAELKIDYDNYPNKFNEEKYNQLVELKDTEKDELNKIKIDINNLQRELSTDENTLQLYNSEIKVFNEKIENIEQNKALVTINSQIKDCENKINLLTEKGLNVKSSYNEILEKINDMKENPTCDTCGQQLKGDSLKKVTDKILVEEEKLVKKKEEMHKFASQIKTIKSEIVVLETEHTDTKENLEINLNDKIEKNKELIIYIKNKIKDINSNVKKLQTNYEDKSLDNEKLLEDISKEKTIKSLYEKGKEIKSRISQYPLLIENIKGKIKQQKTDIKRYNENKIKIEENKNKQISIKEYKGLLNDINEEKSSLLEKIKNIEFKYSNNIEKLKETKNRKNKFIKQTKKDLLFKVYEGLVHRDGIPSVILKKAIPLINIELSNLLQGMAFTVWLNDDLELKMAHYNSLNSIVDAIEGCGKERTFIAVSLKTALNRVNSHNRPNFIMLDEIMGKLIDDSVIQFTDLLHNMKNYYEKIFIIEHNHFVNPDNIIEITKDNKGISSLNIL